MDMEDVKLLTAAVTLGGYEMWTEAPVDSYRLEFVKKQEDGFNPSGNPRWTYVFRRKPTGLLKRLTEESEVSVSVDPVARELIPGMSTPYLFGFPYMGAAAIGIAVLSFPIMLPLSPVIASVRAAHAYQERRTGLDVFARRFLRAAQRALGDGDDYMLLEDAVRAKCAKERALNRKVSLEEARALLASCEQLRADEIRHDGSRRGATVNWKGPNGDLVAQGTDFTGTGEWMVQVLGSVFEGEKALSLVDAYAERRETPIHYDEEGMMRFDDDDSSGILVD